MTNRKKRLLKGIESIEKQIELHEEKKEEAIKQGKIELASYYEKEIKSFQETKQEKERIIGKEEETNENEDKQEDE